MDDLIAFLRARLDEDEAVARHADHGPWVRHIGYISGGSTGAVRVTQQAQRWNADHIVRHDPARVLRDVAADRKLIAAYAEARAYYDAHPEAPAGELHGLLSALKIRAERFDVHDDYQESWRP